MARLLSREEIGRLEQVLFATGSAVVHKSPGKRTYIETLKSHEQGRQEFITRMIWKERKNGHALGRSRPVARRNGSRTPSPVPAIA